MTLNAQFNLTANDLAPYGDGESITVGTATSATARAITCTGTGTATIQLISGNTISVTLTAGVIYPYKFTKVTAATATGMTALV